VKARDLVSVFYGGYPVFPVLFSEEAVFSPMYVFGNFVEN
jgi:hypothetical protein